ncbi:MAG: TonB-dependent receptor [Pseudomonadales bacterium]
MNGRIQYKEFPRKTRLAQAISFAVLSSSLVAESSAQELEEIIVTATKRQESVQDIPLAITAVSGDFIRATNLDDVKDLVSLTPGVTGNSKDSFIDAISIRGIRTQDFGVGGDPSAAFFKNNLYEGRNGAVVTSLFDVDRAEVLRGPQGFLFGRNAIGGAFSVHTTRAEVGGDANGYMDFDIGQRGHLVTEAAVNIPVNDRFALRVASFYSTEDGYVDNLSGGPDLIAHDKIALRLSSSYEHERLSVYTTLDYETREQSGTAYRAIRGTDNVDALEALVGTINESPDGRTIASDLELGSNDDADLLTLGVHIAYDLDWATLESSTGYKDHDYLYNEDYDGSNLNLSNYRQDQEGSYFQTELKLISQTDGPLSWYAGASYYREDIDVTFTNAGSEEAFCAYYGAYYGAYNCADYVGYWQAYYGPGYGVGDFVPSSDGNLLEQGIVSGKNTGWATYVNLDWAVNDQWDVSLGVRYTFDEKEFSTTVLPVESDIGPYFLWGFTTDGALTDTQDWDDTSPRVIIRYKPTDDRLFYASATRGGKSGGFGTFSVTDVNDPTTPTFQWFADGADAPFTQADGLRPSTFKPETVWSYELGYKDTWFEASNVSLSVFMYDYEDLQVNYFDQGARVGNTDEAEGKGAEFTLTSPLSEHFSVYLAAAWFDSEARGLDFVCGEPGTCEGRKLFWAPDFSGAVVLNANYPANGGELVAALEMFWESERGGGWDNIQTSVIDSYQDVSMRIGYESDAGWGVTAYVENLTDELYYDGSANNGAITPGFFFGPSRPRTYGLRFGFEF